MFSTQFVFIPIGLCLLAHLSFRTGELGNHHGVMGIVTAFFGFITFFLEVHYHYFRYCYRSSMSDSIAAADE
jgi:hypothetical protein